jgi:hypothetical protein
MVHVGLIMATYFTRKVAFLVFGIWEENYLQYKLDVVVLLDRGYYIASVIDFLLSSIGCQLLGAHLENAWRWPYCTGANPKEWQVLVPLEGARPVLFSYRKANSVKCFVMCYRNGNKGIGMLPSTLPYAGHWDLVFAASSIDTESISFRTTTVETIYFRWVSTVMAFVAHQGCIPWFEARVVTSTTALNII